LRTVKDIVRSNEVNSYVMSCYATKDDLYKQMREDINTLCGQVESQVDVKIAENERWMNLIENDLKTEIDHSDFVERNNNRYNIQ